MAGIKKPKIEKGEQEPPCSVIYGFGEYKKVAIELLQEAIWMLQEMRIAYFLISGTLLGQVRHNDFIPWDDDIDLMVQARIFDLVPALRKKYTHLNFICSDHMTYLKISFKRRGYQIPAPFDFKEDFCLKKRLENRWPFVDLFTFVNEDESIKFYKKKWQIDKFFPVQNVNFLGIDLAIPADPDYFLRENYGEDYMINFLNDGHSHKVEKVIDEPQVMQ